MPVPEDPEAARLAAETLQALAAVELDGGEAEVAARLRGAAHTVLVEADAELSQRALELDDELLPTLEAIGHELDLTRERVRQLEAQALARLAALRDLAAVSAN